MQELLRNVLGHEDPGAHTEIIQTRFNTFGGKNELDEIIEIDTYNRHKYRKDRDYTIQPVRLTIAHRNKMRNIKLIDDMYLAVLKILHLNHHIFDGYHPEANAKEYSMRIERGMFNFTITSQQENTMIFEFNETSSTQLDATIGMIAAAYDDLGCPDRIYEFAMDYVSKQRALRWFKSKRSNEPVWYDTSTSEIFYYDVEMPDNITIDPEDIIQAYVYNLSVTDTPFYVYIVVIDEDLVKMKSNGPDKDATAIGPYSLTLGNVEYLGCLDELEQELFQWCISEGLIPDCANW